MHALVLNDDEDGDILRLNGGKVDDRSGRMTVDVFNLPGETKRLGQMLTRMSMLLTIEVRSNQLEKKSAFDQVENLHFDQIDNTLL